MKKQQTADYKSIKDHKAACAVLGKDPKKSTSTSDQLKDITDAMNKLTGFKADFKKPSQYKWRPFFWVDKAGFRFSGSGCVGSRSDTSVGSRLCDYVSTEAEADFFGKQFIKLHEKHYYGK